MDIDAAMIQKKVLWNAVMLDRRMCSMAWSLLQLTRTGACTIRNLTIQVKVILARPILPCLDRVVFSTKLMPTRMLSMQLESLNLNKGPV